jgi:hypothetical protein
MVLVALELLRRRMLIERASEKPAFTLQPVILEYVNDRLLKAVHHELVEGQPKLVRSHTLVQATAKDYVRRSQEQLIATPLLERLRGAYGDATALERQLLMLLTSWREQPRLEQRYGPGNLINLLRLLRGHLRGLDLARLAIRQAYLAEVDVQDASLVEAELADTVLSVPSVVTAGSWLAVALMEGCGCGRRRVAPVCARCGPSAATSAWISVG